MSNTALKNKLAGARRSAARSTKAGKANNARSDRGQAALSVLLALLNADRWVFEASELARNTGVYEDLLEFNTIRQSIVKSLNKVQPLAYGAMGQGGVPQPRPKRRARGVDERAEA